MKMMNLVFKMMIYALKMSNLERFLPKFLDFGAESLADLSLVSE